MLTGSESSILAHPSNIRDYDDTWAVIKYNGQEAYVAKEFLTAE